MRRKDREITDPARIDRVIKRCDVCRLGLYDGEEVYVVPMNFAPCFEGGERVFYFHCAKEGRKLDIIAQNPKVGFEAETKYEVYGEENKACTWATRFESVIGTGEMSVVEGEEEREKALKLLMSHLAGGEDWHFDPAMVKAVSVLKLTVKTVSCKKHE